MLSGNVRKRFRRGRKMLRSGNRRLRRSTLLPLKKQVARLSAIANVERHWYDRAATGIQIEALPVLVSNLNTIFAGDANLNRNGNVIKPSFINVRGTIALNPNLRIATARVMLVRDWGAPGGVAPNPNLILDGTYFSTVNAPNAPRYVNQLKRFQVLYDKNFTLANDATNMIRHFDIRVKLGGEIHFFSTNSTDWDKGTIYLVLMDDNTTAANYNTVSYVSRLTYYP